MSTTTFAPVFTRALPGVAVSERAAQAPYRLVKVALCLADLGVVGAAMVAAHGLRSLLPYPRGGPVTAQELLIGGLSLPIWLAVFFRYKLYTTRHVTSAVEEWTRVRRAAMAGTLGIALVSFTLQRPVPRGWILASGVLVFAFVVAERSVVRLLFTRMRMQGRRLRRVVVVGANAEGLAIARTLQASPSLGYQVVGFVDDAAPSTALGDGLAVLGPVEDVSAVVEETGASGVFIATTAVDSHRTNRLIRQLIDKGKHVELSSSLRDIRHARVTVRPVGPFPIMSVAPVHRRGWRMAAKRCLDVLVATVGLIVLAPLLLVVAVVVKWDSPGPVLFRQRRVGRDGAIFDLVKFRSMTEDAESQLAALLPANEASGPLFKMRNDPRVTGVGRWLRSSSIDEIPQLWNVILGDMSLVGPRPLPVLWGSKPELHERLRVRPGMTGMWQVHSRGGESDECMRLDLSYVDNWSLGSDLAILAQTVPAVLSRRGAW
jgi:exopolysaccharide biosynthesis polyprenyl glycosylphosphotransferase